MAGHDAARRAEVAEWMSKAAEDIAVGSYILGADPPFVGYALFHAQQAVEKALKAFLVWHEVPFPRTHDLRLLGEQCLRIDGSLEELLRGTVGLSKYATAIRYPGDPEAASVDDARRALDLARAVVTALSERLSLRGI